MSWLIAKIKAATAKMILDMDDIEDSVKKMKCREEPKMKFFCILYPITVG